MEHLKIQENSYLVTQERLNCPNCSSAYTLYCPFCLLPLHHKPPQVQLPKSVTIIRHPAEALGRTTSIHAKILAPDHVDIVISNLKSELPFFNPDSTLLLYPSDESVFIEEVDPDSFDRLVVLDGTWKQARAMTKIISQHIKRHVRIRDHTTFFWRYNSFDQFHLSTVEAIFYFFHDFHKKWISNSYAGEYDNLLFYFKIQWLKIQKYYKEHPDRRFTHRKLDSDTYIRYAPTESF